MLYRPTDRVYMKKISMYDEMPESNPKVFFNLYFLNALLHILS